MAAEPWDAEDSLWDFSDSPTSSEHDDAEKMMEKISRRVSLSVFADQDGDSDEAFSPDTLHRIHASTTTTYKENALKELNMVSEAIMKADREGTLNLIDFGEVVQSHAEILQAKHKLFCKALKKGLLTAPELNELLLELAVVQKLLALQSLHAALRTLNGHATNLRTSSVNARKTTHKATFALFVSGIRVTVDSAEPALALCEDLFADLKNDQDIRPHWRKLQRKTKKLRRQHDLFGRLLIRKYGGIWKKLSLPSEGENEAQEGPAEVVEAEASGGLSPSLRRKEHKKHRKQEKKEKKKADREKEQQHSPKRHRRRESRSDRKMAEKEKEKEKEKERQEKEQHEKEEHNNGGKEKKNGSKKEGKEGSKDGKEHKEHREHREHRDKDKDKDKAKQDASADSTWVKRKCAQCGKTIKFQTVPAHLRYEMLCPLCGTKQLHRSLEL